jgi:hypothetical protein
VLTTSCAHAGISSKRIAGHVEETLLRRWFVQTGEALDMVCCTKTGRTFRQMPHRILNMDETGFQRDHKQVKGLAPTGTKMVHRICNGSKESITCCAWGTTKEVLPPIFVLGAKSINDEWLRCAECVPQATYALD